MMLQWTDTTAETPGDKEREQEMTHITEDVRKLSIWWLQQKCTHKASGDIATISCLMDLFLFFPAAIHRIKKNAWNKGGSELTSQSE